MSSREGEAKRLMLEARGQQLGVGGSLIFHNRFVTKDELTKFLSATDICDTGRDDIHTNRRPPAPHEVAP